MYSSYSTDTSYQINNYQDQDQEIKVKSSYSASTLGYLVARRFIVIIRVEPLLAGPEPSVAVVIAGVGGQGPGVVEVIQQRVQVINILLESARGPVSVLIKHPIGPGAWAQESLSTRPVLV